jgi:DUF2946 family protein
MHRIVLAVLIAFAVAVAPVGSALAASQALSKQAMEDCHGKKSGQDHSCCDSKSKCPETCGIKCCKLMGMIVVLPAIVAPRWTPLRVADPQRPPDWQLRPRPPPPRA